jgi:hypothetical protein
MNDRARPWRSNRRQIDLAPVLRRSVELATQSGHSERWLTLKLASQE